MSRFLIAAGALALALAVAIGAASAHAAGRAAHPDALRLLQMAVLYQLVHGLGVVIVGAMARTAAPSRLLALAGSLLLAGIVLFCGALYWLAVSGASPGPFAPVGGVCFMAGWCCLAAWTFFSRE